VLLVNLGVLFTSVLRGEATKHNRWALCDIALYFAQYSVVIPAPTLSFPLEQRNQETYISRPDPVFFQTVLICYWMEGQEEGVLLRENQCCSLKVTFFVPKRGF